MDFKCIDFIHANIVAMGISWLDKFHAKYNTAIKIQSPFPEFIGVKRGLQIKRQSNEMYTIKKNCLEGMLDLSM